MFNVLMAAVTSTLVVSVNDWYFAITSGLPKPFDRNRPVEEIDATAVSSELHESAVTLLVMSPGHFPVSVTWAVRATFENENTPDLRMLPSTDEAVAANPIGAIT